MAQFYQKKFSREDNDYLYGFDLVNDTYLNCRFVVTLGLDITGLSDKDAMIELIKFRGPVYTFREKEEFVRMFDTNVRSALRRRPKRTL